MKADWQELTYAREGHPNAHALAKRIDVLEGVDGGLVTGSGMAAVSAALLGILKTGDHVVAGDQLYGRSLRLLKEDLPRLGIEVSLCDATRADNVFAALRRNTKIFFWRPSPTQPYVWQILPALPLRSRARVFNWLWTILLPHPCLLNLRNLAPTLSYIQLQSFWQGIQTSPLVISGRVKKTSHMRSMCSA